MPTLWAVKNHSRKKGQKNSLHITTTYYQKKNTRHQYEENWSNRVGLQLQILLLKKNLPPPITCYELQKWKKKNSSLKKKLLKVLEKEIKKSLKKCSNLNLTKQDLKLPACPGRPAHEPTFLCQRLISWARDAETAANDRHNNAFAESHGRARLSKRARAH